MLRLCILWRLMDAPGCRWWQASQVGVSQRRKTGGSKLQWGLHMSRKSSFQCKPDISKETIEVSKLDDSRKSCGTGYLSGCFDDCHNTMSWIAMKNNETPTWPHTSEERKMLTAASLRMYRTSETLFAARSTVTRRSTAQSPPRTLDDDQKACSIRGSLKRSKPSIFITRSDRIVA